MVSLPFKDPFDSEPHSKLSKVQYKIPITVLKFYPQKRNCQTRGFSKGCNRRFSVSSSRLKAIPSPNKNFNRPKKDCIRSNECGLRSKELVSPIPWFERKRLRIHSLMEIDPFIHRYNLIATLSIPSADTGKSKEREILRKYKRFTINPIKKKQDRYKNIERRTSLNLDDSLAETLNSSANEDNIKNTPYKTEPESIQEAEIEESPKKHK